MKKKLRNVLLALSSLIVLILGIGTVYAGTNDSSITKDRFDGAYAVYDGTDRVHLFYAERFLMNGKTAYCIEPGVAINTQIYSSTEDWSITGLSQDVKNYVRLVAYYGYDYTGHQTRNYYLAAQEMIWEKITGRETYWVTELDVNSSRVSVDNEKNEITRLVNSHYQTPSFTNGTYEVNIGESVTLTDTNGVLANYKIQNSNGLNASISGNTLKVSSEDEIKTTSIQLTRTSYTNQVTFIYHSGDNQKLVGVGMLDPVNANVNIKTVGGNITIEKLDKETGTTAQGDATLKGAKYGVYNSKNELVDTLIFGTKNTSKDLPYGNYTLKEIEASNGYELDETVYNATINGSNVEVKTKVYEDVIKRKVDFFKVYASDKTGFLTGEANVQFDIYLKSTGKLYTSITTDSEGYAEAELVYGTYIVKQVTTTKDYYKVDDFEVVIDHSDDNPMYKLLSNSEITAKLRVIKIDEETGNIIPRAGIKFKIKNVKTDEYVCQRITYPTVQDVCEYETDENGKFITPYELNSGTYKLEEVDQVIDGYVWNKESEEFVIGENSKFTNDKELGIIFDVKFSNKQVKGKIKINKLGEEVIFDNNTFRYDKIALANVSFEVIANEDITIGGKEYYKKGDIVDTIKTDENGNASLDNLPLGKYLLREIKTDDNHVLLDKDIEFEIEYIDQYTEKVVKEFNINNYYKKGTLEFTKIDLVDGTPIPDVEIKIFTEDDEEVFTGVTDNEGKITITDLPVNKRMYIIETRAADNYQITDEKVYFEILENGEVVKASMTNEKVTIEVPNTGLKDSHILEIFGGVLVLSGIGGLITYAIRKKNSKKSK